MGFELSFYFLKIKILEIKSRHRTIADFKMEKTSANLLKNLQMQRAVKYSKSVSPCFHQGYYGNQCYGNYCGICLNKIMVVF